MHTLTSVNSSVTPQIYSYVRFSSEQQLRGDSLRRQNDLINSYAKEKNLTIADQSRLVDLGISAYDGDNLKEGKLGQFLNNIREKKICVGSVLLVESLDRLSRRKVSEALSLFLEIIHAGVTIVTLLDRQEHNEKTIDENRGMVLFASLMVMSRAHEESKTKSDRLKRAWEEKRKNLTKKIYTRRIPSWLQIVGNQVKPRLIKRKADIVKRMFQLCLDGEHCESIARMFHRENLLIVGGSKKWSHSFVSQTLRNPAVTGEFTPHKIVDGKRIPAAQTFENFYPKIVSKEDFHRVQSLMDSRSKNKAGGRPSPDAQSIFKRVLYCGYCGSRVYLTAKGRYYKGKVRRTLLCRSAKDGTGCFYVGWNYEEFEKTFVESAAELRREIGDKFDGTILREEHASLLSEQKSLYAKLRNLVSAIEEGDRETKDSLRSIKERIREYETRLAIIKNRIADIESDLASGLEGTTPLLTLEKLTKKLESSETRKKISDLVGQLFERIDLFPAGSRFQFSKLKSEHARLVRERGKNDGFVSATLRESFNRREHRFYVAVLQWPGLRKSLKFSDKADITTGARLDLVEDLPDDA